MTRVQKTTLRAALLAATLFASTAHAQTPSAFGHWEGVINTPLGSQDFAIDLGPGEGGKPVAALSIEAENISGLPLRNVAVDGAKVSFELPGSGGGKFSGVIAGGTLNGTLEKPFGSGEFSMNRTGEARFAAEPVNAAVDKRFEGEWVGSLGLQGGPAETRIVVANKPGKGAVAQLVVQGGTPIPLLVTQSGDRITFELASTKEALTAVLRGEDELAGDFASNSGARSAIVLKRTAR